VYDSYQTPWLSWVQAALAFVAFGLAIVTFTSEGANRELQKTAAQNEARVTRANTFVNLDNGLIQLTAKSAVDNNDPGLTALLAENGVTFRKNATEAAPAATKP
jgi:hypothetical protein